MQFTSSYTQSTGKDCVDKTPHNARVHPKVKECHIRIKFSSKTEHSTSFLVDLRFSLNTLSTIKSGPNAV